MAELAPQESTDLPPIAWLGLPLVSLVMMWLTPLLGFELWDAVMMEEIGVIEIATAAYLLPAIVLGVWIFLRRRALPKGVGWLMLAGALAALYFTGEEISWGQSWLGFETPQSLAECNVQGEFNVHNIQGWSWTNNLPRQLMLCATVGGGVILPLILFRPLARPEARRRFWYWAIPTWRLVPIAAIAASSTLPEKIYKKLIRPHWQVDPEGYWNMAFIDPAGEFKEYCFALIMFLYMLSIFLRMRGRSGLSKAPAPGAGRARMADARGQNPRPESR